MLGKPSYIPVHPRGSDVQGNQLDLGNTGVRGGNLTPESYSALVLDLDGTLIGANEQLSSRVADAVSKVAEEFPVSIVSGRPPAEVVPFARQMALTAPQVCDGGALIMDPVSGQPLWTSSPLSPEQAEAILTQFYRLKVTFIATYPGGAFTNESTIDRSDLTRISALHIEETLADELAAFFSSNSGAAGLEIVKMFVPSSGLWGVNFAPTGINKGTAVVKLAELLGIETGQMIAAGDSYNDLPLLEACGLRIVMAGAPKELVDVADYLALSAEQDGLAFAIEDYALPRLKG